MTIKPEILERVSSPETLKYLTGWKRPNHAFILWETKEYHITGNGGRWGTGLFTMNVENRPDVGRKFEQYERKGFRILDYGNFPKTNDANPERAKIAIAHSGPEGRNPWDQLASDVNRRFTGPQATAEKQLKAMEAKIAALEAEKKAKQEEPTNGNIEGNAEIPAVHTEASEQSVPRKAPRVKREME